MQYGAGQRILNLENLEVVFVLLAPLVSDRKTQAQGVHALGAFTAGGSFWPIARQTNGGEVDLAVKCKVPPFLVTRDWRQPEGGWQEEVRRTVLGSLRTSRAMLLAA